MTASALAAATFPTLLLDHAPVRAGRPANREKDYGIWQSWSWAEIAAEIEALACGLAAIGFRRGDKLAIIGDNRPRLYWAIAATQALGGVPVPIYQDSIADEMAFVLDHAEVRFAVAEDQEQVDKLAEIKDRCPLLEKVIFSDPRGMRHYSQPWLDDYAKVQERGREFAHTEPGIFESIRTQVMIRMEDAGWAKRRLFHFFLDIAKRVGPAILDRHRVPLARRMLYWLGGVLVYGPLKNTLGFSRIRVAYTAGEAIGPDLFTFYRSLGINLKQLYGMTESSVFLCIQRDGAVKPDTTGAPIEGVEIRIAEDGEILFRSPGAFHWYYKHHEATAAAKRPDGWVHAGDSGFVAAAWQLKILDRARDVGRLRGGALFAPKFIENKLKFFPYIKEAVVFGDARPFAAAFVNIDPEGVGDWAERRNLAYASYQELAAEEAVYDLLQDCIERVNRDLAAEPALAPSQIRRFLILHKELDADDGELTRTRKVRRRIIAERYEPLVEALYSGDATGRIATEITFEDGRKGQMRAELAIRDVDTVPPAG